MKTLIISILLAGMLATNTTAQHADILKKTAREAYNAITKHDLTKFTGYFADDVVDYGQGPMPVKGKEAVVKSLNDFFSAFPDYTVSVESITVDGNKVYVQNTFKGTHTGTLAGMIPATNKSVVWRDVDVIEFNKAGKMVAHWANNPNAVLDQIGYHAFSNPNTAAMLEGYARFGKGDVAGIVAACTDDVVWNVADSPAPNVARIYKGKPELAMFFNALSAGLQITKFEPYRFFADGDDVVAFINTEYKLTGNPKPYKATLIHHFIVRDGKIASFKEVMDKPQEIAVATK